MKEKEIEAKLKKAIEKEGGLFIKLNDEIGRPDRIAVFKDDFYFVEVKREKGKLSLSQKQAINRLIQLGFKVCVIFGYDKTLSLSQLFQKFLITEAYYVKLDVPDYLFISSIIR